MWLWTAWPAQHIYYRLFLCTATTVYEVHTKRVYLHPEFHTYSMNGVWLSYFVWYVVHIADVRCSSYRTCALSQTVLGQRSRELLEEKSIYAFEIFNASLAWSSLPISQDAFLMQVNRYLMKHSVENLDLSVYLVRGGWELCKVAWFYKLSYTLANAV